MGQVSAHGLKVCRKIVLMLSPFFPGSPGKGIRLGGMLAALIGGTALAGWVTSHLLLASWGGNLVPMSPNTALFFLLYGLGVVSLAAPGRPSRGASILVFTFAAGGAVAGSILILPENLWIMEFGNRMIRAICSWGGSPLRHMSSVSALAFFVTGFSLIPLINAPFQRPLRARWLWWVSVTLVASYLVLIIAYFLDMPLLYGGHWVPPSVPSCAAFILLGSALAGYSHPLAWSETRPAHPGAACSSRCLFALFGLLSAGILAAGYSYHKIRCASGLAQAERHLGAVADLKVDELLLWRKERMDDAALVSHNPAFAWQVKQWTLHPKGSEHEARIRAWLGGRLALTSNYERIFLLAPGYSARLILPETRSDPLAPLPGRLMAPWRGTEPVMADFYRDDEAGKVFLAVLAPVRDPSDPECLLGLLVFRIDPQRYLYPFLKRWPEESRSGEIILIRRDGNFATYLNDLKLQPGSALRVRVPLGKRDELAVMAVLGQKGAAQGENHLGKTALAAFRAIPNSPWILVAQKDAEEVFAPMRERLWHTVLLIALMLLATASTAGYLWRQQTTRFYRSRYEAEQERLAERTKAEEGILRSKERLQCLLNVLQYQAENDRELLDFALNEALRMTESRQGYIFFYNELTREFTLNSWSLAGIADCTIEEWEQVYRLEQTGIWGEPVRQRQPVILNDFSQPHPLKKGYPEGHVPLNRYMTIPLFAKGQIVAVVGVANREAEYGEGEVVQLTLLMESVWRIVERRKAEQELTANRESMRRAEALHRINEELERRVKRRTAELEASNRELEAFCYAVAHDLTTPLRSMSCFSEILLEEHLQRLDHEGRRYLSRIRSGALQMGQLINDLLNLSRVTRSQMNRTPVDLSALAEGILRALKEQQPQRVVKTEVSEGIEANVDPVLVKVVLENLLGNAWKYTGKKEVARIEFGQSALGGDPVFFVRDDGIGFDMSYAEKIFHAFERLHGPGDYDGTGIGLATVQRIVTRHGGRVWAEGTEGEGSTFYFTVG